MQKFTFTGCSFTVGVGLVEEKKDTNNYVNLVADHFNAAAINLSVVGNSNYNIFIAATNALLFDTPDVLIVQWSSLNRHWLYPRPDMQLPIVGQSSKLLIGIDQYFTQDKLQKFSDQFRLLNHDFHNILAVINYSKILQTLTQNRCRLVMINGLLPWTKELQYKQCAINPAKYFSEYTKSLLSMDSLPDGDIVKYFSQLSDDINELDKTLWINMFDSLAAQAVDVGLDHAHPGPNSHKKYASMIINYLNK
jgi:hypothetical protein